MLNRLYFEPRRREGREGSGFWFVLILKETPESEQTKPCGRLRLQVVDHAFDAVFHECHVPIQQETELQLGELKICEELCLPG